MLTEYSKLQVIRGFQLLQYILYKNKPFTEERIYARFLNRQRVTLESKTHKEVCEFIDLIGRNTNVDLAQDVATVIKYYEITGEEI